VTYILVAVAPDGTRKPLSREHFQGWNARSREIVPREDAHQMSRKRANQERNRMLSDFDLKGHRVEVEPFVPQPATDPR